MQMIVPQPIHKEILRSRSSNKCGLFPHVISGSLYGIMQHMNLFCVCRLKAKREIGANTLPAVTYWQRAL